MKTAVKQFRKPRSTVKAPTLLATLLAAIIAWAGQPTLSAQVVVDTLGGGPFQGNQVAAGFQDGNTFLVSQFNGPVGVARDTAGNLYIADQTNGAVRKITFPGDAAKSETTTFVSSVPAPTGVAVDGADNVYVLTGSSIQKFNRFASFVTTLTSDLISATALALDGSTNLYVTESGGSVKKVTPAGAVTTVASGFNSPRGITVLDNGLLAVSDTGNHAI